MRIFLTLGVGLVVLGLVLREWLLYRQDKLGSEFLYPYSSRRFKIRTSISLIILSLGLLLIWGPHIFSQWLAMGLGIFLTIVLLLTVALFYLAVQDFKESLRLGRWSRERLIKEMLFEVREVTEKPPTDEKELH